MKYVSCQWIESRVVLEQRHLKFCCIGHSGHKGYVPMCEYDGGALPVEAIRAARRELIRLNNDPQADSGCKGCHFLERRDWDAERKSDALFDAVYVSSFSICNLSCRYCFVYLAEFTEVSNVRGYDLLPVFRELVDGGHLAPGAYIEWGGGEPTIVKNFAEVMRLLLERGHPQQIHTSSVRFSPEVEQGLREGHLRAVTSVDSGTRETYRKVKGRDVFEQVWDTIGRYAATGGHMTVKYILRRDNSGEADVRGFVERCRLAGIRRLVATPDFRELTQDLITEETLGAFALLVHLAEQHGMQIELRDEYVNPRQMKRIKKYVPWAERQPQYEAERRRLAEVAEAEAARRAEHRRANAERTREAVRRAQAALAHRTEVAHPFRLLEVTPANELPLRELLAHQVDVADPELGSALARFVRSRSVPGALKLDRVTAVGVSADAWTLGGEPGYLIVDATESDEPVTPELWFTCWADAAQLPIHLTVEDGSGEKAVDYTFLEPEQHRVELPRVAPGRSAIYAVRTDKTYVPASGSDPRRLGVRISSSI